MTALHCAAAFGHSETCELLISRGADISAKDEVASLFFFFLVEGGLKERREREERGERRPPPLLSYMYLFFFPCTVFCDLEGVGGEALKC